MAYSKLEGAATVCAVAAVDLSSYQFCPVKLIATGVDICDAAGEVVHGILLNDPTAGQHAVVQTSGVAKALAGDAITIGAALAAEVTTGRLVTAAVGDYVIARAMTAAADGQVFTVAITHEGVDVDEV